MLNEYVKNNRSDNGKHSGFRFVKKVVCADGFTMSVQASEIHYCAPRENDAEYYSEVEIGFPSMADPLIEQYAEDLENLTDTVYGYVPVEIVEQVILKHGGIKENV